MEVVETPLPPCLPSPGMETALIWGFPLETRGQSRRGGSADTHVVRWSVREEWRHNTGRGSFYCIYFPLSLMTITSIACITATFERHLQF